MVCLDLLASIARTGIAEVDVSESGTQVLVTYEPGSPNLAELFTITGNTITSALVVPFVPFLPGEVVIDAVPLVDQGLVAVLAAVPPLVLPGVAEANIYLVNLAGVVVAQTTAPYDIFFNADGDAFADMAFSKNDGVLFVAYNVDEDNDYVLLAFTVPDLALIDVEEDNGLVFQIIPFAMACKKSYVGVIVRRPSVTPVPGEVVGVVGSTTLTIYEAPYHKYGSLVSAGGLEEVTSLTLAGVNPFGVAGIALNDCKTEALIAFSAYNFPLESGTPYPIYTAVFNGQCLAISTRTTFMSQVYAVQPVEFCDKVHFVIEANAPAVFGTLGVYKQTKSCDCTAFRAESSVINLPGVDLPTPLDAVPFDVEGRYVALATDTTLQIYRIGN